MEFSKQEYWSGVPLPSPFFLLNCSQFICLVYIVFQKVAQYCKIIIKEYVERLVLRKLTWAVNLMVGF